jgi:hypothetical protein
MVRWYYVLPTSVPPRRSPALSASLTTLLAAVGSAPTRRPADWETPVYASDAEIDDALWVAASLAAPAPETPGRRHH